MEYIAEFCNLDGTMKPDLGRWVVILWLVEHVKAFTYRDQSLPHFNKNNFTYTSSLVLLVYSLLELHITV